jgi:succinate dehydrogenase / fumarate reductase membrane anchor subunit
MLVYFVYVISVFSLCPPADYVQWKAWLAQPWVWMSTALFFVALFTHAWVGLRDVILDYVSNTAIRLIMLVGLGAFLISLTLWVFRALFAVVTV